MKLRTRFILLTLVTTLLAASSVFVTGWLIQQAAEKRFSEITLHGKRVLWDKIVSNHLEQLAMATPNLTRDMAILESLKDGDQEMLAATTGGVFELLGSGILTRLALIDTEGQTLYASDGKMPSGKLLARALQQQKSIRGIERRSDGSVVAAVALPLFLKERLIGAAVLETDLRSALDEFARADNSVALLLTNDGRLLHATDSSLVERLLPALDDSAKEQLINRHIGDRAYTLTSVPLTDANGQDIARLVSAADMTESLAVQRRLELGAPLLIFAILGLALYGMVWYLRRALSPLNELAEGASRLGKGETSVRIREEGDDEVATLAKAFNKMAQRVEDLIESERQHAEDLTGKVELIEEVVELAAKGDLTGQLMIYRDNDVVSELASGIQAMLDSLNNLVSRIQQSGIQVTSSATEIAATARQQEATVSEQAATTNEIRNTVTRISATAKELVNTMNAVTDVALQTSAQANQGRSSLGRMEETMRHMMEATGNINAKLAVLSEKAANINSVVTTINKVADQTNLLSLNAAIEAEKAGEYGAGFAVVATEIRRLADQTAVATWDIEQMVKEMQSAVSAGVMGMEKFSTEVREGVEEVRQVGTQLTQIIGQVENLIPHFEEVHEGMQSQAQGAHQISEAIVQLAESAQQTAESLRQSNGAIQQLNEAAQQLQEGVSHFKVSA
ncbi:methyl-accepting chemotaxis protein [Thiohalobacter sp. IOR34]|uniref:methyl-accepting chemotaxis protein n=1 Tax=Thiohalobacter sp. IOR34 TaxID=3057176 RepID=UPI0025AF2D14|nr:methyl-accepting chemotaxis protein [Thiohalobacter sp. IOR34]WJW74744.1 methyl-accepting chemotaxis protein [Thiohalobacter sp. IOR34]